MRDHWGLKIAFPIIAVILLAFGGWWYWETEANNGWNDTNLWQVLTTECNRKVTVMQGMHYHIPVGFVRHCVQLQVDAFKPCQVEYRVGSDSADKCFTARVDPAINAFTDQIVSDQ